MRDQTHKPLMRVLHLGKFFPPHAGGIERFSADLSTALVARGLKVAMLAHASPGGGTRRFEKNGVDVTLASCHGQLLYAPVSPTLPLHLGRIIRRFKPEVLHLHLPNVSAFWALLSPAARRLPWVVHWHSDVPLDARHGGVRAMYKLYRYWEQALLRRSRAIIATSQPYLDASPALAAWREKTRVIPLGIAALDAASDEAAASDSHERIQMDNGTSAAPVDPIDWPMDGIRLLAVGRLSYYKGFDVLIKAVAQLPELSLLLVGAGECDAPLRLLVRELNIEARVRFAGAVDDAALARAYAKAQIFCLPSTERSEAFGLVLLEAMRASLPVSASAIPGSGVGYVVVDGVTGLHAVPGNVSSLADTLRSLANDAGLREKFGAAGYIRWQNEFTLDRCAQRVVDLYRSL